MLQFSYVGHITYHDTDLTYIAAHSCTLLYFAAHDCALLSQAAHSCAHYLSDDRYQTFTYIYSSSNCL
jgi:hypothetical protein